MAKQRKTASEDVLGELHAVVAHELMNKIRSGEATAAELSAAIKFLKDNGISCAIEDSEDLTYLAREVPSFITADGEFE